ncbi:MAG: DUF1326 domain-containing protein [Proteobacteria bacterium]|nr:DUF1326 domain-containing protein [Pseudomonadota bacterium]
MSWHIKGSYYENCSCTNTCPCTWSSMQTPATNDYCRANLAFKISEGVINEVNMDGVIFVMIVDTPPLMADGNWRVGVVVNDTVSDKQMEALGLLLSGDIGGPPAMLKGLIGEMLGIEKHPVSISQKGNDFHVQIGDSFDYSATIITNPMTGEPVKLVGMLHPAGNELKLANVHKLSTSSILGVDFVGGENLSGYQNEFSWAA